MTQEERESLIDERRQLTQDLAAASGDPDAQELIKPRLDEIDIAINTPQADTQSGIQPTIEQAQSEQKKSKKPWYRYLIGDSNVSDEVEEQRKAISDEDKNEALSALAKKVGNTKNTITGNNDENPITRNINTYNMHTASATKAQSIATQAQNNAAVHQMEAQQHQRIANQNPYNQASRIAAVQDAATARKMGQQLGTAAGNGAYRANAVTTPDINAQINLRTQEMTAAQTAREKQLNDINQANLARGDKLEYNQAARELNVHKQQARDLAMAQGAAAPTEWTDTQKQSIIDYLSSTGTQDGDAVAKRLLTEQGYEVTPMPVGGNLVQYLQLHEPKLIKKLGLNTGTTGTTGTENEAPVLKQINDDGTPITSNNSDARLKNIKHIISDMNMKCIKERLDSGLGITPEDFDLVAKLQGGKFNINNKEYDYFNDDDDDDDDDLVDAYADNIYNYIYNYKPEAQEINPDNDPSVEHIGPMAQDIEKVNPALIHKDENGIESVDVGRLAMMNAGVIGDLARRLEELEKRVTE